MTTALTISQVEQATGLSVHTLRYYERIGLIDSVARRDNGHRRYREQDLRWIEFLLRLRATGMPVRQMLRYARARAAGDEPGSVSQRKSLLEQHLQMLLAEIESLQETVAMLQGKVVFYAELEARLAARHDPPSKQGKSSHAKRPLPTRTRSTQGSR